MTPGVEQPTNGDALPISETRGVNAQLQVVQTNPDPAPLSLIHAAMERGVTDPGYLEKLLNLQERWESRNARAEYARALNACQREIGPIYKGKQGQHGKYATLEAVNRIVQPVYIDHGFALSFGQEPTPGKDDWIRVFVDVTHTAGHTERYLGDFPFEREKGCTAIQSIGKAFSYARRYLLGLVFNLTFTDEDNDGAPLTPPVKPPRLLTQNEIDEIARSIAECEQAGVTVDQPALLKWLKVEKFGDLTVDRLGLVLWMLNKKRRGDK